jgi:hypothetical protein
MNFQIFLILLCCFGFVLIILHWLSRYRSLPKFARAFQALSEVLSLRSLFATLILMLGNMLIRVLRKRYFSAGGLPRSARVAHIFIVILMQFNND